MARIYSYFFEDAKEEKLSADDNSSVINLASSVIQHPIQSAGLLLSSFAFEVPLMDYEKEDKLDITPAPPISEEINIKIIESHLQKSMSTNIFEGLNQEQTYDSINRILNNFNTFYINHINHKQKILEFLSNINFEETIHILIENKEIKEYQFITDLLDLQKIDYSDPFSAGSISKNIYKQKKNGKSSYLKKKTNFYNQKISKKKGGKLKKNEYSEIEDGDKKFIECAYDFMRKKDPVNSVMLIESINDNIKKFINNVYSNTNAEEIKSKPVSFFRRITDLYKYDIPTPYLITQLGPETEQKYKQIQMYIILKKNYEFCSIYEYIIDNILNSSVNLYEVRNNTYIETNCITIEQGKDIDHMREVHHRYIGYLRSEIIFIENNRIFFENELYIFSIDTKILEKKKIRLENISINDDECIKQIYCQKIKESFEDKKFILGWNKCQEYYIKIYKNKDVKPTINDVYKKYSNLILSILVVVLGVSLLTTAQLGILGGVGILMLLLSLVRLSLQIYKNYWGIEQELNNDLTKYFLFFKKDAYIEHPSASFKKNFFEEQQFNDNHYKVIEREVIGNSDKIIRIIDKFDFNSQEKTELLSKTENLKIMIEYKFQIVRNYAESVFDIKQNKFEIVSKKADTVMPIEQSHQSADEESNRYHFSGTPTILTQLI